MGLARFFSSLVIFPALAFSTISSAAIDRVGDFALLDEDGEFHQISRYIHRNAVVMMSYSPSCAGMDSKLESFNALHAKYVENNIEFLLIDSSPSQELNGNFDVPMLRDSGQLVTEALEIANAGEVMVFNPERLSLFYRGPVDGELSNTLENVVNGQVKDTVKSQTMGCSLEFPVKEMHASNPPDYSTEVALVVLENCSECHRWGGVGPFALDSYISVLGWSPMIREVLLNKRMPPMQVDPSIGHSSSAKYISTADRQTLIHWMAAGAPRGDGEVDPLELVPIEKVFEWDLGEPDFIVESAPNEVPAVGIQDYVYSEAKLTFDEDKWVRAFQYRPGKEAVLHHLMTFVSPPEEGFWGAEENENSVTRRFMGSYIPGANPATQFPEGAAVFIPKGYKLSMQSHYVSNGVAAIDETTIGLYFSDQGDNKEILTQAVSSRFVIPPYENNHPMHASYQFDEAVQLTAVRSRMNFRGKKMKFTLETPDGAMQDIFSIPAYNYGWQPNYTLDQPQAIPAGSIVHVIGAFDNSLSNPFNPDPTQEVEFGLNSWEEMFTGYLTFYKTE
jgi:hypothetical protein|tara:strand:+ start:1236 stop:2915 length:1680 start_codon:yes stop_codon:yes gene_type:complete